MARADLVCTIPVASDTPVRRIVAGIDSGDEPVIGEKQDVRRFFSYLDAPRREAIPIVVRWRATGLQEDREELGELLDTPEFSSRSSSWHAARCGVRRRRPPSRRARCGG